jgi:hypothetical protein
MRAVTPDLATPIIGYRSWVLDTDRRSERLRLILRSMVKRDAVWPVRKAMAARCLCDDQRGYIVPFRGWLPVATSKLKYPTEAHSCGIYAFKNLENTAKMSRTGPPVVFGKCALWGRVIEHERGYRAQFAYPLSLFASKENLIRCAQWIGSGTEDVVPLFWDLANVYGVDGNTSGIQMTLPTMIDVRIQPVCEFPVF